MKIYFHFNIDGFTNSYVIANDDPDIMEAIIIDPGKISNSLIKQIEDGGYTLTSILVTHNHSHHVKGLSTLQKIYSVQVYAADTEVAGTKTNVLHGEGELILSGLKVEYMSVPGHTADSLVYKIGNILFTGDTINAGFIGSTTSQYSEKLLRNNIQSKILSQTDKCIIMPGHGPPTTVEAESLFNLDLMK